MSRPGSGNDGCNTPTNLAIQKWHTLTASLSGKTWAIRINGKLQCKRATYSRKLGAQTKVQVWSGDPWYASMNGWVRKATYTAWNSATARKIAAMDKANKVAVGGKLAGGRQYRLKKNKLLTRTFSTAPQFLLQFDLYTYNSRAGWRNIFHFTKGGNCCGITQRMPAFWLIPNTFKVHCRMSRPGSGNDGCNTPTNLAIQKWHTLTASLSGKTWAIRINGKLQCKRATYSRKLGAQTKVQVWSGDPWYASMNGWVRKATYTAWNSATARKIAAMDKATAVVKAGTTVWGVNRYYAIWYRNGVAGGWKRIPTSVGGSRRLIPGGLKQVAVSGNNVWGVNPSDMIWYRAGTAGSWRRIPGGLKQISVSGNNVWGVNRGGAIYYRAGVAGSWRQIPGGLKQVAVSGNNVWGVNSGDAIWHRTGVGGSWRRIPGGLKQISVSGK
jgi:hypothetical protein